MTAIPAQSAAKRPALSSVVAAGIIFTTLVLTCLAPVFFNEPPAALSNLIVWIGAALLALAFILVTIRRGRITLKLPPLLWPFIALACFTLLSSLINYPQSLITPLVGNGGLFIASTIIIIFGSQLLQLKNQKIVIKLLLCLSTFTAIIALYVAVTALVTGILPSFISTYYPNFTATALNITIPALAGLLAVYLKKGKLSRLYLITIPVLVVGLAAALAISLQFIRYGQTDRPSSNASFAMLKNSFNFSPETADADSSLIKNTFFDQLQATFFGRGSENYSFIFSRYYQSNHYQHAWNLPLTVLPTFGLLVTVSWLWLLIMVWLKVFKPNKQSSFAIFTLAISLNCQLFLPPSAVAIALQSVLVIFCLQSQSGYLVLSTRDKALGKLPLKIISYLTTILVLFGIFVAFIRVGVSYLAYYYHEQSLRQVSDLSQSNIIDYYDSSRKAVKLAPDIDIFNQFAGVANLELALRNPQQTDYLTQAIDYATKATVLGPMRTSNWLVLSHLYQDLVTVGVDTINASNWAIRAAANAILTDPNNPNHYLMLGNLYVQQNASDQALPLFQEAMNRLDETDPNYHQNLRAIEKLIAETNL